MCFPWSAGQVLLAPLISIGLFFSSNSFTNIVVVTSSCCKVGTDSVESQEGWSAKLRHRKERKKVSLYIPEIEIGECCSIGVTLEDDSLFVA